MSKSTYPLKLPNSIKEAAAQLAREDGVSLNQFIASAVAEKVGVLRTASEFLRERARDATPQDLLRYLRAAPTVSPAAARGLTPHLTYSFRPAVFTTS
ncbi:MAG: pilus assembly protein HicB [Steroidobacteraceae bacterium]